MPVTSANNIKLHYQIIGDGEPLLFIHGLGSSARDWQEQVDFFSKKYQVILVDVRGHGLSDKPPGPYSIPQFSDDIAGLINSLELDRLHVVGLSMGGMIAYQMAVDHSDLLKSMTAVNCNPEFVTRTMGDKIRTWQRFAVVRLFGMKKIGKIIAKRLFVGPEYEDFRKLFAERWAENDPKAYLNSMHAIVGWSVVDKLSQIQCPVLVLASELDYSPVSEKEAYMESLSNGKLVVIEKARHALPKEMPDIFNKAVESFLTQI